MAQPYVGEIRMFAGSFAPAGWMNCSGQLLPISENEILFNVIGTTYGGDGQSTFALPDLQSRLPIHQGTGSGLSNRILGETGGTEQVTITTQTMPAHTHPFLASLDPGGAITPAGNTFGAGASVQVFRPSPANQPFNTGTIGPAGGSQPHDNMQPFLCINYIISLFGLFPPPS
jgi:microcystin-dependent protein